nr:unnamed protein product [Callosobruchus chinensis]CAH7754308.1 unnamed protein product [Callosobruchus chinensis]
MYTFKISKQYKILSNIVTEVSR